MWTFPTIYYTDDRSCVVALFHTFNLQTYYSNYVGSPIVTCLCYALGCLHSCSAKQGLCISVGFIDFSLSLSYVLIIIFYRRFVKHFFYFFGRVPSVFKNQSTLSSQPIPYSLSRHCLPPCNYILTDCGRYYNRQNAQNLQIKIGNII